MIEVYMQFVLLLAITMVIRKFWQSSILEQWSGLILTSQAPSDWRLEVRNAILGLARAVIGFGN